MGSTDALIPEVTARIFERRFGTLLDCACGFGKWGYLARVRLSMTGETAYIVGCDIWPPNLQFCREHKTHDDYVRCDARSIPFRDHSFEIVLACELLEHLSKPEGEAFIKQAEKIASRKLIISTPNGAMHQDALLGNEFQKHRSAWVHEELRKLGFDVKGVGAFPEETRTGLLRFLGRGRGLPALGSMILGLAAILSPRIPRVGTGLVASKNTQSD